MKTIDIKFAHTDSVLFSYTCEDNTVRKTLQTAIESNTNLAGAFFDNEDLSGVDCSRARLVGAHFKRCKLSDTNFKNAFLYGAFFEDCHVQNSNIVDAHNYDSVCLLDQ